MQELKERYFRLFHDELANGCIPFWLNHGQDRQFGGVLNCLDERGEVYSDDKSVWMQGRTAYTYATLYNDFEQDPRYLQFSKSCLDFLEQHCCDTDKRMFFTVTRDGKPLRKRRYWFSESFYIVACAEYYRATGDKKYLQIAQDYYNFIFGIYSGTVEDPYKITPKVIASTRDMKALSEPMILLNTSAILRRADSENADTYTKNIDKVLQDIACFYNEEHHCMLENVTRDNRFLSNVSDGRVVNPGHDIECSWFLAEEGMYRKDETLCRFAQTVFNDAIKLGWDREYGGILYFVDISGHPVQAYEHDMKLWWTHNEAVISSLTLYKMTGKQQYKEWFQTVTEYAFSHFSDSEYGEWYGYLRRDGVPTQPICKGHTYKGAFHVMRMLNKVCQLLSD